MEGWKAVPQLIDEVLKEELSIRGEVGILGLLFSITSCHDPRDESEILPDYKSQNGCWTVSYGFEDDQTSFGMGWSGPNSTFGSKPDLKAQLQFAQNWKSFRDYIVVRDR